MMHLLEYNKDGDFSLTEFIESNIPKYAILSHRWGAEEVNFKDLTDGTSKSKIKIKNKAGYDKIRFCGEQARRDKLQYFWVDTCCIDKSNSTELAEAINSMFRWYQKAVKCYVYLSDVSTLKQKQGGTSTECTWESAFRASEWFTRGWTLQELLAPRSVEFFSREGNRLGDKGTLEQQIHEITGIPVSALKETPLSQYGVDERLSWAENRQTTREEDQAYSLMGIFDIHMTLIYGEGREKAIIRLRNKIVKHSTNFQPEELRSNYQSYTPIQNFRKRKKQPVEELEARLAELEKNSATIAEENELLKLQLQKAVTENEILKATSVRSYHGSSELPSNAGPMRYSPKDFYAEVLRAHEKKVPSHRIVISHTGERLLAAGATWDYIIKHPLYGKGLVDVGDISERLKRVAKCDGQGPIFEEREIINAIEMSVASGCEELL